jgi:hypothetical protein
MYIRYKQTTRMKKINLLFLALLFTRLIVVAQSELNTSIEFFLIKNESTKQVVVTNIISVTVPDGNSLSGINKEVKAKLSQQMTDKGIIKAGFEGLWNFAPIATTEGGEFFADESEAAARLIKIKADMKKKGYEVSEFMYVK